MTVATIHPFAERLLLFCSMLLLPVRTLQNFTYFIAKRRSRSKMAEIELGGGSEAAILWQPVCALIDEQTCARYVGEIALDGDMPKRIPLWGPHHLSDSGYARAALTTLLRWHDSVKKRDGALFTDSEIRDIYAQVRSVQQLRELAATFFQRIPLGSPAQQGHAFLWQERSGATGHLCRCTPERRPAS